MKQDLFFTRPFMNAAGSLGFTPDPYGPLNLAQLGAFITNPISIDPRTPARGTRCLPFAGGFLLHTGYPNPGFREALRQYGPRWARSPLPVFVHLLAGRLDETAYMVRRLEEVEGVFGIELGLPPDGDQEDALALTGVALGELPIIPRLPLEQAIDLAPRLVKKGAAAVSLAPPRGALVDPGGRSVFGRMYGPAVFPLAFRIIKELACRGIPVLGAGGVYRIAQADAMLDAGAIAVQFDSVLWLAGEIPS